MPFPVSSLLITVAYTESKKKKSAKKVNNLLILSIMFICASFIFNIGITKWIVKKSEVHNAQEHGKEWSDWDMSKFSNDYLRPAQYVFNVLSHMTTLIFSIVSILTKNTSRKTYYLGLLTIITWTTYLLSVVLFLWFNFDMTGLYTDHGFMQLSNTSHLKSDSFHLKRDSQL